MHHSEYAIASAPLSGAGQPAVLDRSATILDSYLGLHAAINTFLTERIDERKSGYAAPLVVTLHGSDFVALDHTACQMAALMEDTPGVGVARQRAGAQLPQVQITPRIRELSLYGLADSAVRDAVGTAFNGRRTGGVLHPGRPLDLGCSVRQHRAARWPGSRHCHWPPGTVTCSRWRMSPASNRSERATTFRIAPGSACSRSPAGCADAISRSHGRGSRTACVAHSRCPATCASNSPPWR
jgi:hypothetical protein